MVVSARFGYAAVESVEKTTRVGIRCCNVIGSL
jgi:hypothetical protein